MDFTPSNVLPFCKLRAAWKNRDLITGLAVILRMEP